MWQPSSVSDTLTQGALFPSKVEDFLPPTQHVNLRIVGQLPVRKRTLPTLEATQGQILSQSPTDATSSR